MAVPTSAPTKEPPPPRPDFIERGVGGPAYGSASPSAPATEKITIIQEPGVHHCATFQLLNEDHTMGNTLRYFLMKNSQVDFAGYAIPHPSNPYIHLHVQTRGIPASDAFEKSLDDFEQVGNHMLDCFRTSVASTTRSD